MARAKIPGMIAGKTNSMNERTMMRPSIAGTAAQQAPKMGGLSSVGVPDTGASLQNTPTSQDTQGQMFGSVAGSPMAGMGAQQKAGAMTPEKVFGLSQEKWKELQRKLGIKEV
jgi:hypothetical protein